MQLEGQFLTHFKIDRIRRRQVISDLTNYKQAVEETNEKSDFLLNTITVQVCKDLNLSTEFFEEQCQKIAELDPNF